MKLAINYSPQAAELVEAGQINIDMLKCPDNPDLIEKARRLKPSYVHFPLNAGTKDFSPDWKKIEELKKITSTRFINIHLTATTEDYPDIPLTSQNSDHQSRIIEKAIKDVQEFISRFGRENVILENDTYHAEARSSLHILRPPAEPHIISEVIRQTRCGLLLDIDHARVSSHYMGMSLTEYVAQLPTDQLKELHMTGTKPHPQEGWLQSHHPMLQSDWGIFDWALQNIREGLWAHPEIYTFEYGGVGGEKYYRPSDKSVIAEQVPIILQKIATI